MTWGVLRREGEELRRFHIEFQSVTGVHESLGNTRKRVNERKDRESTLLPGQYKGLLGVLLWDTACRCLRNGHCRAIRTWIAHRPAAAGHSPNHACPARSADVRGIRGRVSRHVFSGVERKAVVGNSSHRTPQQGRSQDRSRDEEPQIDVGCAQRLSLRSII